MGTLHTNGTEYIKAPEILILSAMNKIREYHRGSNQCGQQADVWSLGCLLFEIIANDYMLYDADWIRFFLRTITPSVELVPPKSLALLNCLPVFQAFIMWILVRDPLRRPSLDQIRMKGLAVRDSLLRQNVGTRTELQLINYRSEISDLIHEKYFISHKHTKAAGA